MIPQQAIHKHVAKHLKKTRMKRIILGILLIAGNSIIAQNLSTQQLLNLQKKGFVGVEEYLSEKDWSLLEIEKAKDGNLGTVIYAYNKSSINDKAESFLYHYYSDTRSRINIQVHKKEKYNEYLKSIKTLGYKLVANKMEDDRIEKVYQNTTTTVIISIKARDNYGTTESIYSYFVLSNDDYDYNFKDDY